MRISTNMIVRVVALVVACSQFISTATAQSIGDNMTTYLKSALNTRVGGGRSAHLASEALRVAGGEFVPGDLGADFPWSGDRVWGTLVTVISNNNGGWSDSAPTNACLPGDVIQFGSAQFGTTIYSEHYTAVIAKVDSSGRPTSVYQQNFDGRGLVQQASIDPTALSEGWMRIYRPITRIDRFNEWKFTIVNNSSSNQTYQVLDGVYVDGQTTLNTSGSWGSYQIHVIDTIGTVPNYLLANNQFSYFVETAKGNEIFDSPDGPAIRQLSQ